MLASLYQAWCSFGGWFALNLGFPMVLLFAQLMAIPMRWLAHQSLLRLGLAMLLEYLKSWLKRWEVPALFIRRVDQAVTGKIAFQNLPLPQKLRVVQNTQRRSRLQAAVRHRIPQKHTESSRPFRIKAIMTTVALMFYVLCTVQDSSPRTSSSSNQACTHNAQVFG